MTEDEFVAIAQALGDLRPADRIRKDFKTLGKRRLRDLEEHGYLLDDPVFCTSFCNFGHDTNTGEPIDHECYVLPPSALQAERDGEIQPFTKGRVHRGRSARKGPRPQKE